MSAIITALQSATLAFSTSQLILTRETRLSRSEKQLLRQLEKILEPLGDHRNYREALQNVRPPFAIPWLGARFSNTKRKIRVLILSSAVGATVATAFHLRSLQTFYDRSSAVVVVDQRPLINFSRCARLLARIEELQQYRASPDLMEKHRDSRALAWVKKELENTPSNISREQFDARVAELAEKEHRMHKSRELELIALGFRPAPRQQTSSSGSGSSTRSPVGRIA
jgi:hypothetical protein